MTLLFNDRSQFKSPVQPDPNGSPGTRESNASPRMSELANRALGPARPELESAADVSPFSDKLRDLHCRVMAWLNFDFCLSHAGWVRNSRMDTVLVNLCESCANYTTWDRAVHKAGLK